MFHKFSVLQFGQFTDHAIVDLVLDIVAIQMNYTFSVDCYLVCMYLMSMIVSYCNMSLYLLVVDINDCVSLCIYLSWLFHLLTHMVWPFCS